MADNQNNIQPNTSQTPLFNLRGMSGDTERDIATALRVISDAIQRNPESFGIGVRAPTESQSNFAQNAEKWKFRGERHSQPKYRHNGNILEDFENGIQDQLLDSLAGGSFKAGIQGALDTFAKEFGHDIRDLPNEFGKRLTKEAMSAFNNSKMGQDLKAKAGEYGTKALDFIFKNVKNGDAIKGGLMNVAKSFLSSGSSGVASAAGGALSTGTATVAAEAGTTAAATAGSGLATAGAGAGAAGVAGTGMTALAATGWGALIIGIIYTIVKVLGPALKGLASIVKSVGKSFNRDEEMRKKRLKNAQDRLEADMKWMAEKPFEILEDAAKKWEETWDSNLRKIGQTQGYDKESVYALYESYADRLRADNLSSVIQATDIVDKLASVLDSGLSGVAAEEFAYVATKLGAAIPTQDFFQYADTYASIAANAISQGKSQSEALDAANRELEQFASNLLYSSRELAGGFSTGLKNSSELFKQATQIAQSAKTYNASSISGTLTSVSALVGAVAPDLADSLVSNVVQAALGGNNNSQLVALRSLANINASNTEFLRAMAEDPQTVFASLFTNLANLQNMSPANYMEVAEGLADVFGIDKAAFARVDFNYLAQAINSMNVNNSSLQENLELLISGQTTTSAEQLKAQEVNRVILDEGLAYVIDSEAGRMIQQHMWDEQRANALMENEYAVSLQGSALEFLEGIRKSFTTLLNFLNPVGFVAKGIANMTQTVTEAIGNEEDIRELLKLGAVGSNSRSYTQLTTRGKDLELTTSLIEMMGGTKGVAALNWYSDTFRSVNNDFLMRITGGIPTADTFNRVNDYIFGGGITNQFGSVLDKFQDKLNGRSNAVSSRYDWSMVGKSFAIGLQSTPINDKSFIGSLASSNAATQNAQAASNRRMQEFLDGASEAAKTMTYEQWVATAKNKGISDFYAALDEYGRTEEEIRSYFEANEAQAGAIMEAARKEDEQLFRDENRGFWDYSSGTSGVFQSAMWFPFFGEGQKYDTRMTAVDEALAMLQLRIGMSEQHTVIGGLEEISRKLGDDDSFTVIGALDQIRSDISSTFVSSSSMFQRCLADWVRYIAASADYTKSVSKSSAWSDLQSAEKDQQTAATLALANALGVFSADELKKMDPQLQANALLGQIIVILQAIMQQNNQAVGFSLADTYSALGMGVTYKTGG